MAFSAYVMKRLNFDFHAGVFHVCIAKFSFPLFMCKEKLWSYAEGHYDKNRDNADALAAALF